MQIIKEAFVYFLENQSAFYQALRQHLILSTSALGISIVVCLPIGILISTRASIAQMIINFFNGLRVLPSLAVLFLVLPYLGLGFLPSLIALTALAFPPILINTYTGLRAVDKAVIEAAYGMGMNPMQVLYKIKLPLAAPSIVAGIRTAAVEVISSATLGSFIGGGGLGDFITRGFALFDVSIMLVGAIPVALLALSSEAILSIVDRSFQFGN